MEGLELRLAKGFTDIPLQLLDGVSLGRAEPLSCTWTGVMITVCNWLVSSAFPSTLGVPLKLGEASHDGCVGLLDMVELWDCVSGITGVVLMSRGVKVSWI